MRVCVFQLREQMEEGERVILEERRRLAEMQRSRQGKIRALKARQRMEDFERQLLDQQGATKVASMEHHAAVHKVRAERVARELVVWCVAEGGVFEMVGGAC